jgi:hypothetical protein
MLNVIGWLENKLKPPPSERPPYYADLKGRTVREAEKWLREFGCYSKRRAKIFISENKAALELA